MSIYRQTGQMPQVLANAPALPAGCRQLWADFLELHGAREYSGTEPHRIGYRAVGDWQDFTGARLAEWEFAAIRKADDEFIASRAK